MVGHQTNQEYTDSIVKFLWEFHVIGFTAGIHKCRIGINLFKIFGCQFSIAQRTPPLTSILVDCGKIPKKSPK